MKRRAKCQKCDLPPGENGRLCDAHYLESRRPLLGALAVAIAETLNEVMIEWPEPVYRGDVLNALWTVMADIAIGEDGFLTPETFEKQMQLSIRESIRIHAGDHVLGITKQ